MRLRSEAGSSWLEKLLEKGTAVALHAPQATLAAAVLLAVASLVLAGWRLGYKTGRLDLVDPQSEYSQFWNDHCREFGSADDVVIVVEGPSRTSVDRALDELGETLARESHLFQAVLHKVDLSRIQAKGLHYLSPQQLQEIERLLETAGPIVSGEWSRLNVGSMAYAAQGRLEQTARQGPLDIEAQAQAERLSQGLVAALGGERYRSPFGALQGSFESAHASTVDGRLGGDGLRGFMLLRLAEGEESFAPGSEALDALRALIAEARVRHPEVQIGLTGLPVLENDEMRSSSRSMYWASLLSLAGVAILFMVGFGGVRHALVANLVLLVGMAWSLGYATLAVGHLNILSVAFSVTLIGIGIDYGIHYLSRYLQLRRDGQACRDALLAASRGVGPAIVTGALTTAIAFFAAALTSFTGVAELGLIAGGGLLLCAVAQLFVLPAALAIMEKAGWESQLPRPWPVSRWLAPLVEHPRRALFAAAAITVLVGLGIHRVAYDHNLLNLQDEGLESVALERKLLRESKHSACFAVSMVESREELLARKARLLALPTIERVEEIASLLPSADPGRLAAIDRIQQKLSALPESPPAISVDPPQDLYRVLSGICRLSARGIVSPSCGERFEQAREALRSLPAAHCYEALNTFQQQMAWDLLARLNAIKGMSNPQPPSTSDLPAGLVARFVGQHQRQLLRIYGRGNLWEMDQLTRFVADVRSVDPRATGHPILAYEASREMKRSYEQAALGALVVIMAVLIFDFRSLRLALLAALPLGLGVLQMFGLLGLLDIPLNPANLLVLPLLLGIGVDYGVHLVHDYADMQGRFRLSASTAVAVLIDALTTIIGFGSLLIATHRGLASLGLVLSIGVGCCMLNSLIVLPALLAWLSRAREEAETPVLQLYEGDEMVAEAHSMSAIRRAA